MIPDEPKPFYRPGRDYTLRYLTVAHARFNRLAEISTCDMTAQTAINLAAECQRMAKLINDGHYTIRPENWSPEASEHIDQIASAADQLDRIG